MKKNLDPKSPEFRDLVQSTLNAKIDLPPLKIPIDESNDRPVIQKSYEKNIRKKIKAPKISSSPAPLVRKSSLTKLPPPPIQSPPSIAVKTQKSPLPPLATAVKTMQQSLPPLQSRKSPLPPLATAVKTIQQSLPAIQYLQPQKSLPPFQLQKFLPLLQPQESLPPQKSQKLQKRRSPPRPEEAVDNFAASVELSDLLNMVRNAWGNEARTFGETGLFFQPLLLLGDQISQEMRIYEEALDRGQSLEMPISVYLDMLDNWKNEIRALVEKQKLSGRRCNNKQDPVSLIPIADLDDAHYIRLESGECWEVESLLDYIQNYTHGKNDASKLKNYSSKLIWKNDQELNRILRHPLAVKSGFATWFNSKNYDEAASHISEKTLRVMTWAASLLASRGDDFRGALERELDEKQLLAWRNSGNNIDKVYEKNKKIAQEIEFTVRTTLKSMATSEFYRYYMALNEGEKGAIAVFDPSFEKNLFACNKGEFCVFGMADQLLATRNSIAQLKKLPIVDLGNRFD